MVQEQRHKIPELVTHTHPSSSLSQLTTTSNQSTTAHRRNSKKILKSIILRTFSNQSFNNFARFQNSPMLENRRMSLPTKPFDYALEYFKQQSTSPQQILTNNDIDASARRHSFAQFDAVLPITTRKRVRAESECNPIRKDSFLDSDIAKKHKKRLDFSERLLQKDNLTTYSMILSNINQICDQKINFGTNWPFDSKLNSFIKQNEKNPLTNLTLSIINYHNSKSQFFSKKDILKLHNFMLRIEKSYQDCEYHNNIHACDVVTATEVLMNKTEIKKNLKFSPEERFSTLLAAACHDAGHPGVTSEHIYKFYKPKRIQRLFYDENMGEEMGHAGMLERFHVSLSYAYLENSGLEILGENSGVNFEVGEKSIREKFLENFQKCILATDMTKHKNAIDSLKTFNLNKNFKNNNSDLLPIIVHLADLSNPAKDFFDALNWGNRVVSEFFEQGDVEKAFGSESVNKVFDREAGRLEDIQIGFIQHLVVPLFVEWCEFLGEDLLMKLIYANLEIYQNR